LVLIGKILRTRGNKGEVIVSLSPGIVAPGEGAAVELRTSRRTFPQTIERISVFGGDAVVAFSGVRLIGEALRLVGSSLYAEVPEAKPGRNKGVLGFQVLDAQGNLWGRVKSQPNFSLNQLLEVEDAGTGEIVYVPWHDSLVVRVDRRAKAIIIDPPAGLRNLNK
jgi:ribosomal 30S subunit maturation factor RimM